MKLAVVNSDDFGWSAKVNAAVVRTHRDGVLTSASLMIAGPAWEEAVEMARENPTLGVGLHVVATCGASVLPHSAIPHLVDARGMFRQDPLRAGLAYAFSRQARVELRTEMEAQFERFAGSGLPWSHADGHQHFHMQPAAWELFVEMCGRHGVHRIRIPREPVRPHLQSGGSIAPVNTAATLILQALCRRNIRTLRASRRACGVRMFYPERVYGAYQTGGMGAGYTRRLLEHLEEGVSEIYFHPGTEHARALPAALRRPGVEDMETDALLDPVVRDGFDALGIRRVTYAGAESAVGAPH